VYWLYVLFLHLEKSIEILGIESTYGAHARMKDSREVVVKIAVNICLKKHVCSLLRKLHKLYRYGTCIGGIVGGRPKASAVVIFSFLIDKDQIKVEVDFAGQRHPVEIPVGSTEFFPSNW
jgi:hypothetical protein